MALKPFPLQPPARSPPPAPQQLRVRPAKHRFQETGRGDCKLVGCVGLRRQRDVTSFALAALPTPPSSRDIQHLGLSIRVCPTARLGPGTGRGAPRPKQVSQRQARTTGTGEKGRRERGAPHRVNTAGRTQRLDKSEANGENGCKERGETPSTLSFGVRGYIYISE